MFFSPLFVKTLILTAELINWFTPNDVVVRLNHGGKVKGAILKSTEGKPFYAFRGIPYAEPPVGELRFKAPIPHSGWNESTLDATRDGPICMQETGKRERVGEEDCLFLNVYTPKLPKKRKVSTMLAVMVFIHGGTFLFGDGTSATLPPYNFMDFDVVLVTLNYRLEALGFLSLDDDSYPGNYGMLDQNLALRWVSENIEKFGGDAGLVTLFGQSVGGACVSYHLLSPLSKGLFHRAIAMSGSSLNPWAYQFNSMHWAKHLANQVGCPEMPASEMINCLRRKPAKEMNLGLSHYMNFSSLPVPFAPTTDKYFLPDHPRILMNTPEKVHNVPIMMGVTNAEQALDVYWDRKYSLKGAKLADFGVTMLNNSISNQNMEIIQMIWERYLNIVDPSNETAFADALSKALSHGLFDMNHYEEVTLLAKAGLPVYAYSYNYEAEAIVKLLIPEGKPFSGTTHCEDVFIMFSVESLGKLEWTKNDRKVMKTLLRLWTNFAKTGNPDPNNELHPPWKTSSYQEIHIQNLDLEITSKTYVPSEDELYHFWTRDIHFASTDEQLDTKELDASP